MAATDVIKIGNQPAIGRRVIDIVIASGDTTGETTIPLNGTILGMFVDIPNITGTTATINLRDEDNRLYYTSNALADDKEDEDAHPLYPGCSVTGNLTAEAVASSQAADKTIQVILIYA